MQKNLYSLPFFQPNKVVCDIEIDIFYQLLTLTKNTEFNAKKTCYIYFKWCGIIFLNLNRVFTRVYI